MDMQTIVIPLGRNGKYGEMIVECARFPEHVQKHIWEYGIRQCLNDAIATKEDEDGNAYTPEQLNTPEVKAKLVAKATKRLDTFYNGDLRAARSSEPADPVEAEAHRMAWADIVKDVKGLKEYTETKGSKDRVMATVNLRDERAGRVARTRDELIASVLAAKPAYMKAAKDIVAKRAATTGDLGIDI